MSKKWTLYVVSVSKQYETNKRMSVRQVGKFLKNGKFVAKFAFHGLHLAFYYHDRKLFIIISVIYLESHE